MRLRNIPEAQPVVDSYPELVRTLDYFALKDKKFTLDGFFPKEQPLHLELGMGRGLFITTLAAREYYDDSGALAGWFVYGKLSGETEVTFWLENENAKTVESISLPLSPLA